MLRGWILLFCIFLTLVIGIYQEYRLHRSDERADRDRRAWNIFTVEGKTVKEIQWRIVNKKSGDDSNEFDFFFSAVPPKYRDVANGEIVLSVSQKSKTTIRYFFEGDTPRSSSISADGRPCPLVLARRLFDSDGSAIDPHDVQQGKTISQELPKAGDVPTAPTIYSNLASGSNFTASITLSFEKTFQSIEAAQAYVRSHPELKSVGQKVRLFSPDDETTLEFEMPATVQVAFKSYWKERLLTSTIGVNLEGPSNCSIETDASKLLFQDAAWTASVAFKPTLTPDVRCVDSDGISHSPVEKFLEQ